MVFILIIQIDDNSWQIFSHFPIYLAKILPPAHI